MYLNDIYQYDFFKSTFYAGIYMIGMLFGIIVFRTCLSRSKKIHNNLSLISAINMATFGILLLLFRDAVKSDYIALYLLIMGFISSLLCPLLMIVINEKSYHCNHEKEANRQRIIINLGMTIFLLSMAFINSSSCSVFEILGFIFIFCALIWVFFIKNLDINKKDISNSSNRRAYSYSLKNKVMFF